MIIVPLKRVEEIKYLEKKNFKKIKILFRKKLEQIEVRECLLSFGAEFFVLQFAIQKYKE